MKSALCRSLGKPVNLNFRKSANVADLVLVPPPRPRGEGSPSSEDPYGSEDAENCAGAANSRAGVPSRGVGVLVIAPHSRILAGGGRAGGGGGLGMTVRSPRGERSHSSVAERPVPAGRAYIVHYSGAVTWGFAVTGEFGDVRGGSKERKSILSYNSYINKRCCVTQGTASL